VLRGTTSDVKKICIHMYMWIKPAIDRKLILWMNICEKWVRVFFYTCMLMGMVRVS